MCAIDVLRSSPSARTRRQAGEQRRSGWSGSSAKPLSPAARPTRSIARTRTRECSPSTLGASYVALPPLGPPHRFPDLRADLETLLGQPRTPESHATKKPALQKKSQRSAAAGRRSTIGNPFSMPRRAAAGKPPTYSFVEVPDAAKRPPLGDSMVEVPATRQRWLGMKDELKGLCDEAVRRRALKLLSRGARPRTALASAGAPLYEAYIADRLDLDDPLDGLVVRHRVTGWLQGFVTRTTFTTWTPHSMWDSRHHAAGLRAWSAAGASSTAAWRGGGGGALPPPPRAGGAGAAGSGLVKLRRPPPTTPTCCPVSLWRKR